MVIILLINWKNKSSTGFSKKPLSFSLIAKQGHCSPQPQGEASGEGQSVGSHGRPRPDWSPRRSAASVTPAGPSPQAPGQWGSQTGARAQEVLLGAEDKCSQSHTGLVDATGTPPEGCDGGGRAWHGARRACPPSLTHSNRGPNNKHQRAQRHSRNWPSEIPLPTVPSF